MKNILALVDLSEVSPAVADVGATIAKGCGARLWIIHVAAPEPDLVGFDAGPQHVRDHRALQLRQEHRDLQALRDLHRANGADAEALLVQGPTTDTVLEEAARLNADMLVLGSHGRSGLFKALMGSVSEALIKRSAIPVLVVPSRKDGTN